jgi:hypothetical protein
MSTGTDASGERKKPEAAKFSSRVNPADLIVRIAGPSAKSKASGKDREDCR